MGSGLSNREWVCCSLFAPIDHSSPENLITRHLIYHYLGAYYQRLKKRMGSKKAIVALAHRILVIIYHLLKEEQSYRELGPGHADEQAAESSKRWAIRRLEQLGFAVSLTPKDHEEEVA